MSGSGQKVSKAMSGSSKVGTTGATELSSGGVKVRGGKGSEESLYYFLVEKVTEDDLKKVKCKKVEVNGESIALISHSNKIYAIQEKCPHYGGPLHQGEIEDVPPEGACVRCPWHSWKFSLTTGKCVSPNREDKCIKIFPVKVSKETREIKIGFESVSESIFNAPP